ncbi:hypothetical protein B7C42_01142 [Nocardia cerradoensis]|uniref:DUF397 domain-containing protein n=1 Tax=Nocardia cerradoensis TaxID=85688 RepID=A0A231HBU8_9NOCA|nr:DUF397 domain-containing protein [Nocardia cerradoensis]OXR46177.1 hypothetical protein B7C42_01142 [Nocardia cerradoensis]
MSNDRLAEAQWFKSTHSSGNSECVEVAFLDHDMVGVRDSKNPSGPALIFTPGEWNAFVGGARSGAFDRA